MPSENSNVIPEAAQRLSAIHNHRSANMDSGLADCVRAPE
jgi:hypothetical protein